MFKDDNRTLLFMGKIIRSFETSNGKLIIELPDETLKSFQLKEVVFI